MLAANMQSPAGYSAARDDAAPWYRIPDKTAVSVEHPCVVKNVDKAISMLGGSPAIAQILEKDTEQPMALNFHPEDPAARPILSINATTNSPLPSNWQPIEWRPVADQQLLSPAELTALVRASHRA